MSELAAADRARLRAWFADQKRRTAEAGTAPKSLDFDLTARDVFASAPAAQGGALGVDFVVACKALVRVDVGRCVPTISSRPRKTTLKIKQRIDQDGIGGVVWHCGRALATMLPRLPELRGAQVGAFTTGTRVLDLGCGTGLVGLACWLRGADVTLTDLPSVVDLALENCKANVLSEGEALPASLRVVAHAWGSCARALGPPFDVVVASDCLYDAKALPDLKATLLSVTDAGSVVYLAYKRRVEEREAPFFADLEEHFSSIKFSQADETPAEWRGNGLHLCRIAGKRDPPRRTVHASYT
ncbi:putative methyltransferase-domain-containing protein [Pelagophyceae sp. CCMP2097]|nr:putative methyltransferase-domain-containing protein [Pelagophyceae sp. CCMP2097]